MVRAASKPIWLFIGLLLSGCVKAPEAGPLRRLPTIQEGYFYPGPLLHLHPLWQALTALEQQANRLAVAREDEDDSASLVELAPLPAPELVTPNLVLFTPPLLRELEPVPLLTATQEGLPEDLRVSLEWHKQLAYRRHRERVAAARAEATLASARVEADLWREYQVALNNLRIQEAVGGPGAAEASESHERILQALENRVAAAKAESAERLAQRLRELSLQLEEHLRQLELQARAEAEGRSVPVLDTGATDLRELQQRLRIDWWLPSPKPVETSREDLFPELAARHKEALQQQQAAFVQSRKQQAARMRRAAGVLRRLIRQDVETAARAQALARGVLVNVPPLEPRRGTDITAKCTQWLRQQWSQT